MVKSFYFAIQYNSKSRINFRKSYMKKILLYLSAAALLISINSFTFGQNRELSKNEIDRLKNIPTNYFIGLSFTNMVPQKEFFDNLPKSGQGFSVYGGYSADPLPLAFGLEFDFLFNGSNMDTNFNQGVWKNKIYEQRDTVSTQSMVIPINIFARIQPDIMGYVFPYVEFVIGMNILTLSQNYSSTTFFIGDTLNPQEKSDSKSSSAFSYGVGIGAMLKLVDFVGLPASHSSLNFDIRLRYMKGDEASYWKTESVGFDINDNPTFKTTPFKSKTDMLIFTAGFVFRF